MRNPPLLQSGLWSGWSDTRVAWDANFLQTGRQKGPAGSRSRNHSDTSCGGIDRNQNNTAQAGKLPSKICSWNTMLYGCYTHACLRPCQTQQSPQSFWSPLSSSQKEFCIWRLLCCLTGWTTFHTVAMADFLLQWHLPQYYIQSEFKRSVVFHQSILWLNCYVVGHKGTRTWKIK